MKKKKIIIVIIVTIVLLVCIVFLLLKSFFFVPEISEFMPEFESNGIYHVQDYQEDDFNVNAYFKYKYNPKTKEYIIKQISRDEFGANSKFEALLLSDKCFQKYKIYELVKHDYVIYEEFTCVCSSYSCDKYKYESRGVDILFKNKFDYSKIEIKTDKKVHNKYVINGKKEPGYYYQPDEFDKDAYIELFEDGTFNVSLFNKIYKGKYTFVKYKYDVYNESIMLDFDDKNIASIRFQIVDDDSFCDRGTCKGDLTNYSFSENFKLVGDWIKEK